MTIVAQGSTNLTALVVPDLIVQILTPDVSQLNGVPTNVLGLVGTAQWGPVNSPTTVGNMADFARQFGQIQNRKYDLGTAVAAAVLQGANNFKIVRVTDGTDVAASSVITATGTALTLTAKYTGTLGNQLTATIANGSKANTFRLTINLPGYAPEVFDNIAGTANALWVAMAAAINQGQNGLRGPSQLVVATAGAATAAPTPATSSFTGGTDGVATITGSVLIGSDTTPRTGMYALRATGASVAALVDCDDSTTWATQVPFGLAEGVYMLMVGPAGDTIANAVSAKATAGIDSYAGKILFGDWCYFNDTVNGVVRLISPQGFIGGLLANLSPEQSSLNKQLYGIVGTQKTYANQRYSGAELQLLGQAGIDVITNPSVGGSYFSARFGRNSSSNPVIHGDNYTRLTNYIAATINAGMGLFVGRLQSVTEHREAANTLRDFLARMEFQGMIGNAQGTTPFSVQIDDNNNPSSQVALGIQQADVKVQYLSVIEFFLVNVMGGQSVQISRQQTQLAA